MASVTLDWNGDAYLQRVERDVQRVIETYAYLIEQEARRLCPVRTGKLMKSIRTELEQFAASIGTDVEYAPFVEFGTENSPAQPFLFPAFELYREDFIRDLERALA